jgi:hypothetical protein
MKKLDIAELKQALARHLACVHKAFRSVRQLGGLLRCSPRF